MRRTDARGALRPVQVHVPAAGSRRLQAGSRSDPWLRQLQGVRAAPPGSNRARDLEPGLPSVRGALRGCVPLRGGVHFSFPSCGKIRVALVAS